MRTLHNRQRCTKCLKFKPTDEFDNSPHCAACRRPYFKAYNKKRYASPEFREAELERGRRHYRDVLRGQRIERKKKLIRLIGGKCCKCSYSRSAAALDFHHIKAGSKGRTISHLLAVSTAGAFRAAQKEARKCRLLCSNCHREETYPGHEL